MFGNAKRSMCLLLAVALCTFSLGTIVSASASPPPRSPFPLTRSMGGQEAIRALGPSLAAVAANHGRGVAELAYALGADNRLKVDRSGRLFYQDAPAPTAAEPAATGAAPFPLDQTFELHSLPGSKRTIYLDFDGHVLTNTAWNTDAGMGEIQAPAWDLGGTPGVFTDAERAFIQSVWQRVAEDYAPFDVDVTTELASEDVLVRSSAGDDTYGVRVLVSPISNYLGPFGGLAYVGVFEMTSEFFKPALVFPEWLSDSAKNVAEACTHEAGHTLGLLHDGLTTGWEYYSGHGTGDAGWAPIMGCAYTRNLSQWSKGEYLNANNTEDDLAVIQANGCPARADDHADSAAGAVHLAPGTSVGASGLIGVAGDTDVVALAAGAGRISLAVAPASLGPDLDVLIELRDEADNLVAAANPIESLSASLEATVPAGTYYVHIRGTGKDDPATGYSSYGSMGAWSLVGTVPDPGAGVAPVARGSVSSAQGVAPLSVTFDGAASTDPDGEIASWDWQFGDGSSASGVQVAHAYTEPGVYDAALTVTDGEGFTDTWTAAIAVEAPNAPPVAVANSSVSAGDAPLSVTFDGSGSYDVDGAIASWTWRFDDGSSTEGAAVTRVYATAGVYSATLTVSDDGGASASTTLLVRVLEDLGTVISAGDIRIAVISTSRGRTATASVRVADGTGSPVEGANVAGTWSGVVTGSSSGISKTDGWAQLVSRRFKRNGTVTFSITSVSKPGYVYDASVRPSTSVVAGSARPR